MSISNRNTTRDNLPAGATFTGGWEKISADNIIVTVYSDQDGELTLQYRRDSDSPKLETETVLTAKNTHEKIVRFSAKREFKLTYKNLGLSATTELEVAMYFSELSNPGNAEGAAVFLVDPSDPSSKVGTFATLGGRGLIVSDPKTEDIVMALDSVVEELRMIRLHLNLITEFEA